MDIAITGARKLYIYSEKIIAEDLDKFRRGKVNSFILGGAYGVDAVAARIIHSWRKKNVKTRLVLPANRTQVDPSWTQLDWTEVIEMPDGSSYMDRNEKMLDLATVVAGFPRTNREVLRSGTWATLRRAKKRGMKVAVFPMMWNNTDRSIVWQEDWRKTPITDEEAEALID